MARPKEFVLRLKKERNLSAFQAFVLGAFAKAVASTITYPLVRLKTILQAGTEPKPLQPSAPPPAEAHAKPAFVRASSTSEMMRSMSFREDVPPAVQSLWHRFVELYRGIGSTLTKSVLQAAVLYMTKDQVSDLVRKTFKVTARVFFRKSGSLKLGVTSGRPLAS